MKQLLLGPRLNHDRITIGGSEVLFENWIAYCDQNGYEYNIVDLNKFNYCNLLTALIDIFFQICKKTPKSDIVFLHGSKNDYFFIAPIVTFIAKMFHKPVYLKKFGGDFDKDFFCASKMKRWPIAWAMRNASGLYWETKRLLLFGNSFNRNSIWSPNTRQKSGIKRNINEPYQKRFVFMSHVRKEKGVDEMLDAFRKLGPDYSLDIYGTLIGYEEKDLDGRYKGVIPVNKVPEVLSNYQLLLLSSWKEGYPGIIVEAFDVGLPVIASRAGGIPEMIEDGKNGLLCDVHNVESLIETIKRLNNLDFPQMVYNALDSFKKYDSKIINAQIINEFRNIILKERN